jgi:hypothetical protein
MRTFQDGDRLSEKARTVYPKADHASGFELDPAVGRFVLHASLSQP